MQKILHTGGTGFFSLTWSLDTEEKFKNFLIVNTKRNNLLKNSFLFSLFGYTIYFIPLIITLAGFLKYLLI